MTMSDRIVVLNEGTIQQVGTPDEIYHEPANLFVADFIGSPSMNMFPVRLDGDALVGDSFSYRLPDEQLDHVREFVDEGEQLVLGSRPENIQLVDESRDNAIRAHLDVREPVGSDNFLYLTIDGEEECRVRVPGDVKPEEGTDVAIRFDESNLHLFREDTGWNVLANTDPAPQATATGSDSVATAED